MGDKKEELMERLRRTFENLSPENQAKVLAKLERAKGSGPSEKPSKRHYRSGAQQAFARRLRSQNAIELMATKSVRLWRTNKGQTVGIAFATEQQPQHWFLGLPREQYTAIVLLCQAGDNMLEFVLPQHFVTKYRADFDRSAELKFHIVFAGERYHLSLPTRRDRVPVDEFLGGLEILRALTNPHA